MAEIETIQTIVHADFFLMQYLSEGDPFISAPAEEELRGKWDAIASSVADDHNSRLVYMSWLTQREIDLGGGKRSNPWKDLDYRRQQTYAEMLGSRLTVIPLFPRYSPTIKDVILGNQPLSAEAKFYSQGEWTDACVKREGRDLADLLGIKSSNRKIVVENSRFSWEGKALLEWHHDLRVPGKIYSI